MHAAKSYLSSFCTVLLHVFFGLPSILAPLGSRSGACPLMFVPSLHTCPSHLYLFSSFCIQTSVWPVQFQSSSFMILSGKNMSSILFRHTNTMNFFEFLQLFQVSHPYKSKELTWVSNIVIILLRLIFWDLHMYKDYQYT